MIQSILLQIQEMVDKTSVAVGIGYMGPIIVAIMIVIIPSIDVQGITGGLQEIPEKSKFVINELERFYGEYSGGNDFPDESNQSALSQVRIELDKVKSEINEIYELLDLMNKAEAEWRVESVQLELDETIQEKESLETNVFLVIIIGIIIGIIIVVIAVIIKRNKNLKPIKVNQKK